MKTKTVSAIMLALLLVALLTTTFNLSVVRAEIYLYDLVFIEPEVVQVYVGESLVIFVEFGYGFEPYHPPVVEFSLGWDASLLELLSWESQWHSATVIVGEDHIRVAGDNPGPFGPTLLWIIFEAKAVGSTILDLYDSNVSTSDGYVDVLPYHPPLAIHNIDTGLDYTTIQEAINALETRDGHTILVDAGIYFEHVVVNKSIAIVGENKHNTIIDGSRTGTVVYVSANNVTITDFTIQDSGNLGAESGIYMYNSSFSNITCNIITYTKYGIRLDWSNDNFVTGNIASNSEHGIHFEYHSGNNTIADNTAANNHDGIWIWGASDNIVTGNNVTSNSRGINIAANNIKIVRNNVWSNGADGILLGGSNNSVASNNVSSNDVYGIRIGGSNHILCDNNVSNNEEGIMVYYSNRNNLTRNMISNNVYGINLVYYSMNNILVGNIISNNLDGIRLVQSCNNNTLTDNNVLSNSNGIRLRYSSVNNMIYHNNFIDNTQQVVSDGSSNTWDDDYPSGGNYWSNYTDADLYSGPYQNVTGSDGIWDHPYTIDDYNEDSYPLVEPWTPIPGDVNDDGKVDDSDLSDLNEAYGSKTGDPNWNPDCDFCKDNKVDALDLFDLSKNYGKTL